MNKELEQALASFREAVVSANASVLSELLSENLSYGHSDGEVEGKNDFVSKVADGTYQFLTMELTNQSIGITDNTATVRHQLDARTNDGGRAGEAHLFVLMTWIRSNDKWQLLARQAVKNTAYNKS